MSRFGRALRDRQPDPAGRRWLFVPYDQLSDGIGPLFREDPRTRGIVLVETSWKPARRPYHKQKLALVLANLRHFALEQAARGVAIRHVAASGPYRVALQPLISAFGPLRVMEPAERELRADLAPLVASGGILLIPTHEGWLTTVEDFRTSQGSGPPWRMDAFYRHVRRRTGILMRDGKPAGGKFSFDPEKRLAWPGDPPAPRPPRFRPDQVTEEVHGIDQETGKKVQRLLKVSKLKVQAAIQGEQLRVTGKQRDDLQAAMALIRRAELGVPLQFKNFRD